MRLCWWQGCLDFSHTRNPVALLLQTAITLQDPGGSGGLYYVGNLLSLQAAYGAGWAFSESISEADALSSPFHIFFFSQTKPMGFSSAWFPFHAKTSHTSSGTKHCIKLFSYSIKTHGGIKHRHLPFFTGLLGKSGDTGNASELRKSTEVGSAAVCAL